MLMHAAMANAGRKDKGWWDRLYRRGVRNRGKQVGPRRQEYYPPHLLQLPRALQRQ